MQSEDPLTPYFANALGASRLGTALFANTQVMLAGRMAKENEQFLESVGMFPKGTGHYEGTGKHKHWEYDPSKLKDMELAKTDIYKWIHDTLAATVAAAFHIDPTTKEGQAELGLKLTQGAQRGNMGGLWADVDRNYATSQEEGANIAAQNADMLKHFLDTDPIAKLMAFNAAENELLVTLGSALMGPAVDGLKALTAGLRDLTDWAKAHPEASKDITVIAAGLALLAKGASELALVVFVGAPLVNGVTALGTAATAATAPITGLVAAIGLIAKMGSDSFTPENRKALDDLAKKRRAGPLNGLGDPQDGFGPDGLPIVKEPGRGHGDKLGQINIHVDGDRLASIVVDRIGRAAGPLAGPGSFDPRRSYTPIEVG